MVMNKNVLIKAMKMFLERNLVDTNTVRPVVEDNCLTLEYEEGSKSIEIVVDYSEENFQMIKMGIWYDSDIRKFYNENLSLSRIIIGDDVPTIIKHLEEMFSYMTSLDLLFDELRYDNNDLIYILPNRREEVL